MSPFICIIQYTRHFSCERIPVVLSPLIASSQNKHFQRHEFDFTTAQIRLELHVWCRNCARIKKLRCDPECWNVLGLRQRGVVDQIRSRVDVVIGGRIKADADEPRRRASRRSRPTGLRPRPAALLPRRQPLRRRLLHLHQLRRRPSSTGGRGARYGDGGRRGGELRRAEGRPAVPSDAGRRRGCWRHDAQQWHRQRWRLLPPLPLWWRSRRGWRTSSRLSDRLHNCQGIIIIVTIDK